jgi:hypothetical protein
MGYIIVSRNPRGKKIIAVTDDDGNVAEFGSEEDADQAAANTTMCIGWGYEILKVEP